MIVGVGIDVVDLARFGESLGAHPGAARAAVHPGGARTRPLASLAARFAAKEALAKALGAPGTLHWHDAEVVSEVSGRPLMTMRGTVLARAEELGVTSVPPLPLARRRHRVGRGGAGGVRRFTGYPVNLDLRREG